MRTPTITINRLARARIAKIAEEAGIDTCEVRLDGCLVRFGVAPAHRHPRRYYLAGTDEERVAALSDVREWVAACVRCHTTLDDRSRTTEAEKERIFDHLRP